MKSLIDSIRKMAEHSLANEKCEGCIFKVLDFKEEPCLSCVYGKYDGKNKNFLKEETE